MLYIFSFFTESLFLFFRILAILSPSLGRQISGRNQVSLEFDSAKKYIFIYVSSAGELEQGIPVAEQMKLRGYESIFFCFSKSAIEFAEKIDINFTVLLSPIDSIFRWDGIFKKFKPEYSIVVRWELWPCFIFLSKKYTKKVLCIDVSFSKEKKSISKMVLSHLLNQFNKIYLVDKNDVHHTNKLGIPESKLKIVGDTKYDRVISRAQNIKDNDLSKFDFISKKSKTLIIGSAWEADWKCVIDTYISETHLERDWKVLIAPHDLSVENLDSLTKFLKKVDLSFSLYTDGIDPNHNIIVIDTIGLLASLYKVCDLAFVGGALHHRVHNVLEPSCFGLPVAFGPHYKTSKEAISLVGNNLATVVKNRNDLSEWWLRLSVESERETYKKQIIEHVNHLGGATSKIITNLGLVSDE